MLKGDSVPYINHIILSSWKDDWKIGVEANCWDIICVAIFIEGIKTLLCLIIPDFDMTIVSSRYQVRAIERWTKVNAVDTCLMTYKRVVCAWFSSASFSGSRDGPDFDGPIERRTGEHICVFRIDSYLHDIVLMILVRVNFLPTFVPVDELNCLVIWATDNIRKCGMHS